MDELLLTGTTYLLPLIVTMVIGGAMTSVLGDCIAEPSEDATRAKRVILKGGFFAMGALWCLVVFIIATLRM